MSNASFSSSNSTSAAVAKGCAGTIDSNARAKSPILSSLPFDPQLEVSFACPECDHTCRVLWEKLAEGVNCPACESSFHILPDRLQKRALLGPVEITFDCPRCRQGISLPATKLSQGTTCAGCQLELLPGPDKKLHDREELKKVKPQARQQSFRTRAANTSGLDSSKLRLALMLGLASLGLLTFCWFAAWLFHTTTVEERSQDFTRSCLAGDWNDAAEFVAAEDYQQQEFKHWHIMHFSSLSVAVKNAKDWPEIEVAIVKEEPSQRTLRVEMASALIGRRSMAQIWQWDEARGTWQFDALTTLKNLHAAD